jgi:hypothetical protein
MGLGETPWVERSLKPVLPVLRRHVPASWLPRTLTERVEEYTVGFDPTKHRTTTVFKHPVIEEYGCGSYGCVMPTHEQGLVMKLTSDPSEAAFIARALELDDTVGIVTYKKIFALNATFKRRPLFVLWRTEAQHVGAWQYTTTHADTTPYARNVQREADTLLRTFKEWAHPVHVYVKKQAQARRHDVEDQRTFLASVWRAYEHAEPAQDQSVAAVQRLTGLARVGVALRTCLYISQEMQGNPSLYNVGAALGHYLEHGILLADVHGNNIGLDDEGEAVITDPGHAVEFHPRWAEPAQIPVI